MSKLLSTPSQPIRIIVTPSTPSPYTTYHSHSLAHSSRIHHPSPIGTGTGYGIGEKHTAYASSSASGSGYVSRVLDFGSAAEGGARARSFDMTYRYPIDADAEYGYDSEKAGLISSEDGEYELSTISSPYRDSDQYAYSEPSHSNSHSHNHYSPDQALLSPSAPYISHSQSSTEPGLGPTGRRRLNILAFMLALVLMGLGFISVIHPDLGSSSGRGYNHMGMDAHAFKRGEVLMRQREGAEFGLEDGFTGLGMGLGMVQSSALGEKERAFNLKKRSAIPEPAADEVPKKMHIGFVPFPMRHEYDLNHPHSNSKKAAKSDGIWNRIKRDLIPLPFAKTHWGSGSVEGEEDVTLESHLEADVPVLNLIETTPDEAEKQKEADIEVIQFPENEADGEALDEAMLAKNPKVRVLTAKEVQRMLLEESRERMEKRRRFLQERR